LSEVPSVAPRRFLRDWGQSMLDKCFTTERRPGPPELYL
jgi:hypothetical protein